MSEFTTGLYYLTGDEIMGCQLFADLSVNDHFNLRVGKWTNVENLGGFGSFERSSCDVIENTDSFVELLADSTFIGVNGGGALVAGQWLVVADTCDDDDSPETFCFQLRLSGPAAD